MTLMKDIEIVKAGVRKHYRDATHITVDEAEKQNRLYANDRTVCGFGSYVLFLHQRDGVTEYVAYYIGPRGAMHMSVHVGDGKALAYNDWL